MTTLTLITLAVMLMERERRDDGYHIGLDELASKYDVPELKRLKSPLQSIRSDATLEIPTPSSPASRTSHSLTAPRYQPPPSSGYQSQR